MTLSINFCYTRSLFKSESEIAIAFSNLCGLKLPGGLINPGLKLLGGLKLPGGLINPGLKLPVKDDPVLFFSGSTRAYFEKTSMQVIKYLSESFWFASELKSTRSACQRSLTPCAYVFRRGNFVLDCLCSVYAFCPINHSRSFLELTRVCLLITSNPLKLPACFGSA